MIKCIQNHPLTNWANVGKENTLHAYVDTENEAVLCCLILDVHNIQIFRHVLSPNFIANCVLNFCEPVALGFNNISQVCKILQNFWLEGSASLEQHMENRYIHQQLWAVRDHHFGDVHIKYIYCYCQCSQQRKQTQHKVRLTFCNHPAEQQCSNSSSPPQHSVPVSILHQYGPDTYNAIMY